MAEIRRALRSETKGQMVPSQNIHHHIQYALSNQSHVDVRCVTTMFAVGTASGEKSWNEPFIERESNGGEGLPIRV